jgi:cell division protein FtsN
VFILPTSCYFTYNHVSTNTITLQQIRVHSMAQGYSKSSGNRSRQKQTAQPGSAFKPFLFGVLVGAAGMYFGPTLLEPKALNKTEQASTAAATTKQPPINFTFPGVFQGTEVIIPKEELADGNPIKAREAADYLLQIGSFRQKDDAESLRGQVTLLNLPTSIEPFKDKFGDRWHRVLVGPFANGSKMAAAQARLAENDLKTLLVKRKD